MRRPCGSSFKFASVSCPCLLNENSLFDPSVSDFASSAGCLGLVSPFSLSHLLSLVLCLDELDVVEPGLLPYADPNFVRGRVLWNVTDPGYHAFCCKCDMVCTGRDDRVWNIDAEDAVGCCAIASRFHAMCSRSLLILSMAAMCHNVRPNTVPNCANMFKKSGVSVSASQNRTFCASTLASVASS